MNDTEKEIRLKRLKYRANHRGIKEMDIILGGFAEARLDDLEDSDLDDFEKLMQEHDRDLIIWFTGEADMPDDELRPIFDLVNQHISISSDNV